MLKLTRRLHEFLLQVEYLKRLEYIWIKDVLDNLYHCLLYYPSEFLHRFKTTFLRSTNALLIYTTVNKMFY